MTTIPTILALSELTHIDDSLLNQWRKTGTQIYDFRELVTRIWHCRTKPAAWIETFDRLTKGADTDSHEGIKRRKTAAELTRLNLINGRLAGESYSKTECEQVMASLASALTMAVTELQASLPSQLEGLNAESVSLLLDAAIYKLREQLADLESDLWERVYQATPEMAAASNIDNKTTRISTKQTTTNKSKS